MAEDYQSIVNERDRLFGDLNYLKKKIQSVITENEKLQRCLAKHDLSLSQGGGDSFDRTQNGDPLLEVSYQSSSSTEGKVRKPM